LLTDDLVKILQKHPGKILGILGWCEKCQDDLNGGIDVDEQYDGELYGLPVIILSHSCKKDRQMLSLRNPDVELFEDGRSTIRKYKKLKNKK
jgi:hypothetical protein